MRMILPGVRERRTIDRQLTTSSASIASTSSAAPSASSAASTTCAAPRVEWFEYLDWGRTAGRCYEDGKIHLVHPENWKKGRKYNSERKWIQTVYHELGHYVLWADAERKADTFACRFVRGVYDERRTGGRPERPARRSCSHVLTAVHADHVPADPARSGQRQRDDRPRHVLRDGEASARDCAVAPPGRGGRRPGSCARPACRSPRHGWR